MIAAPDAPLLKVIPFVQVRLQFLMENFMLNYSVILSSPQV